MKRLDLIVILCLVALNMGWTWLPLHLMIMEGILALPLIFFFPGYTLAQLLLHERVPEQAKELKSRSVLRPRLRPEHPIGPADQLLLGLGLSMAIDVLVGFGLNILPIGLQAPSWINSLGLLTTIFVALIFLLQRKNIPRNMSWRPAHVNVRGGLLSGLAILITILAIWLAIAKPFQPQSRFTQLWIVPANQQNKSCTVSVGAQSFESTLITYHVIMTLNETLSHDWPSITLAPGQTWSQSVAIAPGTAKSLAVEVRLYRLDRPTVTYRNAHLTFTIATMHTNGPVQKQCVFD